MTTRSRRTGPSLPTGWRRMMLPCKQQDCPDFVNAHLMGTKKCGYVHIKSEISGKEETLTKAEFRVGRGKH